MSTCAILSFRLGGIDGVSRVSALWQKMFENLGFDVYTVAGEGTADHLIPGLAISAVEPPKPAELEAVLADSDIVVVENLCTIPLNIPAALAVAQVLANKPAIMHHHDPPWQRAHFAHITELPIFLGHAQDDPAWRHVVINKLTQKQMSERNITAVCMYNPFDMNPPQGDRAQTRSQLGVGEEELLLAHPVRALPIKNIPKAIEIAEELGGVYWIMGPTEPTQDYGQELAQILELAKCRTIRKPVDSVSDIYAASDLVVFPSHWESFGMPPVEASIYGRHVIVGDYPVAEEMADLGFKWFRTNQLDQVKELAQVKDGDQRIEGDQILKSNWEVANRHLCLPVIQTQLQAVLNSFSF